jgi:hypothetical protein
MPSGTAAEIELTICRSTSENAEEIELTIGSRFHSSSRGHLASRSIASRAQSSLRQATRLAAVS